MDELTAIGVTFPVHCSYYILAGSTTALDSATVLKQCFTDSFGDDFIVLDIETFVSSTMKEVVAPKLQSFVHMGWGADFGCLRAVHRSGQRGPCHRQRHRRALRRLRKG